MAYHPTDQDELEAAMNVVIRRQHPYAHTSIINNIAGKYARLATWDLTRQ